MNTISDRQELFSPEVRRVYESLSVPFGIFTYDGSGISACLFSAGCCRLFGVSQEKLLQRFNSSEPFRNVPEAEVTLLRMSLIKFAEKQTARLNIVFHERISPNAPMQLIHIVGTHEVTPAGQGYSVVCFELLTEGPQTLFVNEEELLREHRSAAAREVFCSLFNVIYLVNLLDGSCDLLVRKEETAQFFNPVNGYLPSMTEWAKKYVWPEDQELVISSIQPEAIRKKLSQGSSFSILYREITTGSPLYEEMTFYNIEHKENPELVVFSCMPKDAEIRREMEERATNARLQEVIGALAGDYTNIYSLNLDTLKLDVYKLSGRIRNMFGDYFKTTDYMSSAKAYVKNAVAEEDQADMRVALSAEDIHKNLQGVSSYEKIYTNNKGELTEMKVVRTGANTVIMGFGVNDAEIRRRKNLELTLQQALDEARRASDAKSTFLFSMSHDIRTPLNAVTGFIDLARKNHGNPRAVEDYLKKATIMAEQLTDMLNNILEMARIEKGTVVIDSDLMNMNEFISSGIDAISKNAEEKGISVTTDVKLQHKYLIADKTLLSEILLNLFSNACKYTLPGGSIRISVSERPGETPDRCIVDSTVEDTGVGMSKEFQEHAFEEFCRERTPLTSNIQGTGLGLPIVKRLVGILDGTISMQSELGKGTKVTVSIPHFIGQAPKESHESADEEEDMLKRFRGKRVLLAEDNDMNAEIVMGLLDFNGIEAERVANGLECVEALQNKAARYYDLILMDIQMPVMDGLKATHEIRSLLDPYKAAIPIVALSANAFKEDIERSLACGMNGHLAKPINVTQLMHTLNGIIK